MPSRADAIASYCKSHGGVHQRAQSAATRVDASPLAGILEGMFGWGEIKASVVRRIAAAGVAELALRGITLPPDSSLARLAHGTGHTRRAILRQLKPPAVVPSPVPVRVPCVSARENRSVVVYASTKVYMINEIFECLYRHFPARFQDLLGDGLEQFWATVRDDDPRLVGNPILAKPNWRKRTVPLIIHGDGAQFTSNQRASHGNSLACVNAGGLLSKGWSIRSWLLSCWPKLCRAYASVFGANNDTWKVLNDYMCLGFSSLFHGYHPAKDPYLQDWQNPFSAHLAGKEICDGHFAAIVWVLAADREWASNEWGVNHWNARSPCSFCPIPRNYHDVSLTAHWKMHCHTGDNHPGRVSSHVIWGIPGVSRFTYMGDWGHGMDGGPLQVMHFECLSMLQTTLCGGLSKSGAARHLFKTLQGAYEACGISSGRLQALTPSHLERSKTGTSTLKTGMSISKTLVQPLLHLARQHLGGTEVGQCVVICYEHLWEMYKIIDKTGLACTEDDALALLYHAECFLLQYNMSGIIEEGKFRMTNKFHGVYHLAYFARFQHPRAAWTYVWEDFIGRIQRIGKACLDGTKMHLVSNKIMENYHVAVSHTLKNGL